MTLKSAVLLVFLLSLPIMVSAQQKPQYSQYMINNYLLNPAITGIEDYADIKLGWRNQWTGIDGSPQTFYLTGHTRIGKDRPYVNPETSESRTHAFAENKSPKTLNRGINPYHGIGIILLHDKFGAFSRTEANVTYAFHLPISDRMRVAAGASAGVTQEAIKAEELNFDTPDPAAVGGRAYRPNLALGLWLYSVDFYVGVSGTELLANTVTFGEGDLQRADPEHHYFLTGAYRFDATERLAIVPSVMVKWLRPLPISIDYNARLIYNDRIWAGASYRQNDGFAFLAGLNLTHMFDLGYSYDLSNEPIGRPSHEVVLGIRLFNRYKVLCPQNMW
jgi:type IX secretion system PorP/SprF family membrane protein